MALKVAIVGLSPTTHDNAPWGDGEWKKWGMAWDGYWAQCDRIFDIHDARQIKKYDPERLEIVDSITQENFPLEAAIAIGGDLFACSISYMIAMAIIDGASHIAIFGVTGEEGYDCQKHNINYWIGIARGRGIIVDVADECLTQCACGFAIRYGWL